MGAAVMVCSSFLFIIEKAVRRSPVKYELFAADAKEPSSTKRPLLPNKKFNLLSPPPFTLLVFGREDGCAIC